MPQINRDRERKTQSPCPALSRTWKPRFSMPSVNCLFSRSFVVDSLAGRMGVSVLRTRSRGATWLSWMERMFSMSFSEILMSELSTMFACVKSRFFCAIDAYVFIMLEISILICFPFLQ